MMKKTLCTLAMTAITMGCLSAASAGLILHLPLNEGDTDAIRETVSASPVMLHHAELTEWVEGANGQALCFKNPPTGKRALLSVPVPGGFDLTEDFSLSFFVKMPAAITKDRQYEIFSFADDLNTGPGLRVLSSWGRFVLCFGDGTKHFSMATSSATLPIKPETWYHVGITYTQNLCRIFIDGILVEEKMGVQPFHPQKKHFHIGASHTGGGYAFEGVITNVKLFNQALTPAEMATLSSE
ncbi:MAG: LamG domain-containing protein [Lentisphaerae bacterium]|jgi:hypothetical protein|nr:LamG domain-containing protein [Lentisphaerota bacterium]